MSSTNQPPASSATVDALFARALADHRAGRLAEAATAYRQILALRPELAEVHSNLGMLYWHAGQIEQAVAEFQQSLLLKPELADPFGQLAAALRQRDPAGEIAARFAQALAEAHNRLGMELRRQNRFDEAAMRFEQALARDPNIPEAHCNLGSAHWYQGNFDDAVARFRQAVALRPNYVDALANLGHTLREQFHLAEAEQVFQRLLAIAPDLPSAQLGLGMCYLIQADYERGWPAFEARLRIPGARPLPNIPLWTGQYLTGRSILLVAEAGLGDTLQLLRYARLLKARGARVVLEAQKPLARLLAAHPDVDALCIQDSGQPPPRCDFCLPMLSLPGAFRTSATTIPRDVPYLWANPGLADEWRRELAPIAGAKVGIAWQGSSVYISNRWRSIPLACFAPLARVPGVQLISLQKGNGAEQAATAGFPLLDLSGRLDEQAGPFMDTAAVIGNLDLVITTDTAIGHLAAALGAPVWIALNASCDWRWQLERDDSPWYPNVRLFRQQTFGQWGEVMQRMAEALATRLAATSSPKDQHR